MSKCPICKRGRLKHKADGKYIIIYCDCCGSETRVLGQEFLK
jgi:hypothetical protein